MDCSEYWNRTISTRDSDYGILHGTRFLLFKQMLGKLDQVDPSSTANLN